MRSRRDKREGGFTLLELLMVVIIIAILASIALPQYLRAVKKAARGEALPALATIRSANQRYLAQFGVFTSDITAMDVQYAAAASNDWNYSTDGVSAIADGINTAAGCQLLMDLSTGVIGAGSTPDENGDGC